MIRMHYQIAVIRLHYQIEGGGVGACLDRELAARDVGDSADRRAPVCRRARVSKAVLSMHAGPRDGMGHAHKGTSAQYGQHEQHGQR